ncbi:hypothetical protein TTHERM_00377400 (macronuclear) [Tetrahymena thermophila SB210]|uniref:Uncharacterized protein n=1 Tax=Tetrahymena thermophila (strain SB210) TaxID=312017 RepID=Q23FH8_TETTS|nr:hypothetical protein TTHERM_00377400 [Tetrahymena thermophila SB210]EAR95175.1 hypothetical protein TTHERM_00377400 [Tetrahymena thermophila SB210]|eukprot:XP_001015420.1 hypothetical protein TTHERM_00377400 [Tetrahymena thermophila SB210]
MFNRQNNQEEKKGIEFKQLPFKFRKYWDGDFYYAKLNEIEIPIPNFVEMRFITQLFQVVEEIEKSSQEYLERESPKLKIQILEKISKEFINKNQAVIDKHSKKPQGLDEETKEKDKQKKENKINKQDSKPLKDHVQQQQIIYNQDVKQNQLQDEEVKSQGSKASSKKSQFNQNLIKKYQIHNNKKINSYENDLKKFFVSTINYSLQNGSNTYKDIQKQIKLQEKQQQAKSNSTNKIKNPYLQSEDDYQISEEYFEKIMNKVDKFGVDRCQVQEKINQALKTETVSINFKENKKLKTIIYSILYRNICQKKLEGAKKFIYKILGYINPKQKGFKSENFLLRQIFLHFLCILLTEAEYKQQATTFLNTIFSFEFLSSLILDYMQNSAQKILKVNIADQDEKDQPLQWLAQGYNLDLFLFDSNSNFKKLKFKRKIDSESNIIFIYFEQSLNQEPNQAVYFVINPSDQLIALM